MKLEPVLLLSLVVLASVASAAPFSATWDTTKTSTGSSNSTTIWLPITGGWTTDWGDGTVNSNATNHTYATAGVYIINITNINEIGFRFNNAGDRLKIINITQWGDLYIGNQGYSFAGCANLNFTGTDNLNLSRVTTLTNMFYNANAFNGNIGGWNTSSVTNMAQMFQSAYAFNQNISNWDTSKVTTMNNLFCIATAFNQPIGNWNTSKVTNMQSMLLGASAFNQNISNWDVSSVTDMGATFWSAAAFNQPIGNWNTSKVTNMRGMFFTATAFNQPIGNWDTSSVTSMEIMFNSAYAFNQSVGNWDTSKVTDMSNMFDNAGVFNQNISGWNTSKVTTMSMMFNRAYAFNQPIGSWNTSSVTNMYLMFGRATAFNQSLNNWDTSKVTDMSYMFIEASAFNQPLGNWDTSKVTAMSLMFQRTPFNQNIGSWNVSSVTDMGGMFDSAKLASNNYDALLNGWASRPVKPSVNFNGGNSMYSVVATTARNTILIANNGWTITDNGMDATPPVSTCDAKGTWNTTNQTVTLNATDANGVFFTTHWVNGVTPSNATTFTVTITGNNTITFQSVDTGGNTETNKTCYVAIKYNATSSGLNVVKRFTVFNGSLYCADLFSAKVLRYDGATTWTLVGAGFGYASELAVYEGKLYVGGNNTIFRYDDGTLWTPVGGGTGIISALVTYNGTLYAGTTQNGSIYRYNGGTNWAIINSDANNTYAATAYNGSVLWAQGAYPNTATKMGNGVTVYATQTVENGSLNYIAATYNGSTAAIFINGVAAGTRASNVTIQPNINVLYVGDSHGSSQDNGGEEAFNGVIDEVHILNRGLSAAEISKQYQSNLNKLASDKWLFTFNQTLIPAGTYSYYLYANGTDGPTSYSEERTIQVT
ncbi:MAG: BspA family leucine-rich repeat surface protein [Candidatus Micrarchaeia archaeon]